MSFKRYKLRFRIENEASLTSLADFTLSRWAIAGLVLIIVAFSLIAGAAIVFLTPIHTLLPGYMKENQRSATEESLMRLDSLHNVYETNRLYIDNYLRVLNTDRGAADSTFISSDTIVISTDSLLRPSERERKFVEKMEERERFNISVLAPLAADGMVFSNVSDNGIFTVDSKEKPVGEVMLPLDGNILSVADGKVIDSYYSNTEKGFVVIICHPRGFISRYSRLGAPMVSMNEEIYAGQVIAQSPSPDKAGKRYIYIRMWHNGEPVIPYNFIREGDRDKAKATFGAENSFESPRGK